MERTKTLFAWSATFALLFLFASTTWAQIDVGNFTISGAGEIGGLPQSVTGKTGKFEEYRDIPSTVIVPELQLMIGGKKEDYYVDFDGLKPGREDQKFSLRAGRYGLLDVQFEWDQIPHIFNTDTSRTPFAMNGGNYTLGSRPTIPNSGNTCATNSVCQWLGTTAHGTDLGLLDRIARLKIRYTPTPGWTFSGTYWSNHDTGQRAFGVLNGFSSSTNVNISELAEPIDYQTHNVEVGAEYAVKGYSIALKYNGSFFRNGVSSLTWDNPVHAIVGGTTVGSSVFGGTCVDSNATYNGSTGVGPCQGRLALYPDNQAHTITLTGTATLPLNTRFLATASYGWRLQDEKFLPFTINRCYTSNPALVGTVSANCTVPLVAMPGISNSSLGGDYRPMMVNTTLVNNSLMTGLNLKAFYRFYDIGNHSNNIRFLNNTIVGNDTIAGTGSAVLSEEEREDFGYSKNTAGLQAGYDITRWMNAKFSYTFDKMHRVGFETVNSNENTLGPTIDIKPLSWLLFRGKYEHSWRDSDASQSTLQMVYLGKRDRDKFSLYADVSPWDTLGFHGGFEFTGDTYPNGKAPSTTSLLNAGGLQYSQDYSPSVGFIYSPLDWLRFFGDYNYDKNRWKLNMNNSTGVITNGIDTVNTFSLGSDMDLIKNVLGFRIQYTFSEALTQLTNFCNPGCSVPLAVDYPNTISTWHELLMRLEYQVHKNVAIRLGYYFNALRGHDYGTDIMKQWMGDISAVGDNANQIGTQQRSIFLGDQLGRPYTAHVGFLALRLSF